MLYLVGTPIGNLGDLSPRAKEILSQVDLIACEDTRRTGILLKEFGIEGSLISYHEHNKAGKGEVLINKLREGKDIALVSDAGMPSVSDPGEDLVKQCIANDLQVTTVPGPVAAVTALVLSGLDTTHYHFEGFLPSEGGSRKERLKVLTSVDETMVIYEAPHRLLKLIGELIGNGFGDCRAAFCRELTKKYEEVIRLTVSEAKEHFEAVPPRGEFVVCLEPIMKTSEYSEEDTDALIRRFSDEGMSTKQIASEVSAITGKNKKELYSYILNLLK